MKHITRAIAITTAFTYSAGAHADGTAASAAPAAPSLGAVIAATPGLSLTGYVAASYTDYSALKTATPQLRQFDTSQNAFELSQASVTASYLPVSGAGVSVTLVGGSDATVLRNAELTSGTTNSNFDVLNAYGQYVVGSATFMAGKLATLAGAEVAAANANNEVSRSLLFTLMEPISHTGLRASYAVADALTLTAGVNNGWNYVSPMPGTSKTIELGASGTPSKVFTYSASYYRGQSTLDSSSVGNLQLLDLVGTFNATDALSFTANVDVMSKADYRASTTAKANGIALYANYALNDQYTLSARGEYIDDQQGMLSGTGVANKLDEVTLALNYAPAKPVKLSGELRQDHSSTETVFGGTSNQTSFELQGTYSF